MSTELLSIILSGQLILVLWQVYKEIMDRRDKKRQAKESNSAADAALRSMVFKLYRDSMEQKILNLYPKVDSHDADLMEALMLLQDDMEFYIKQGGNGLIKELYIRLAKYVREKLGERYYVILVIDNLEEFSHS